MINLSTCIKSRRQNIGLTQKQLAKLVGVTDVTVSRWESGQREPIASDFLRLCEVLGMELSWFTEKENWSMKNKVIDVCTKYNLRSYFILEDIPGAMHPRGFFNFTRNDNDLSWGFTIFMLENEHFEKELDFRIEEMLKNLCMGGEENDR